MNNMNTSGNVPNIPVVGHKSIELKYNNKIYKYSDEVYSHDKYETPLFDLPKVIINGIKNYSTEDNPNIEGAELQKFKQQIHEEFYLMPDKRFQKTSQQDKSDPVVIKEAYLNRFDRIFEDYAGDGKITPEEYTKMLILFLKSSYFEYNKGLTEKIIDPNTVNNNTAEKTTKKSLWDILF